VLSVQFASVEESNDVREACGGAAAMKSTDRKQKLAARFPVIGATSSHRMCGRKRSFDTERQARISALAMQARYGDASYTYQCPLCSRFHLTTGKKDVAK